MSARILVVDDNPLNVKLLAAKLAKDYYFVSTAENGLIALEKVKAEQPDLILLDIMMPELDGFETCKRLKADPTTAHIPVVMVTALSDTADRVHGLEVGADDFLTKPINDVALMARVRSLLRLKMMMDEWRLREATAAQFAFPTTAEDEKKEEKIDHGRVLLLEDDPSDRHIIEDSLRSIGLTCETVENVDTALAKAQAGECDMVMTSLDLLSEDGLFLCAQLRAHELTRTLPILLMANEGEIDMIAKGLDLGANDYLMRPLEGSEMITRTRTQLRQKRHYDHLRHNYEKSLSLALVDALTGAYNRRYLDTHLPRMFERCTITKRSLSVLYIDLDHFKNVNDTYGHPMGDLVLKELVNRITQSLRPPDLIVRHGGEEFAVILPDTELKTALNVGERLREAVASVPFPLDKERAIPITVSIGAASINLDQNDSPAHLLSRADAALYQAKQTGRNKVVGDGMEPSENVQ